MIEETAGRSFCNVCSHEWPARMEPVRFASLDDLVARTGLRRDEVVTLADLGALNSFGYDRRSALWQAERAVRPSGGLFANEDAEGAEEADRRGAERRGAERRDAERRDAEHRDAEHRDAEHRDEEAWSAEAEGATASALGASALGASASSALRSASSAQSSAH